MSYINDTINHALEQAFQEGKREAAKIMIGFAKKHMGKLPSDFFDALNEVTELERKGQS